MEKTAATVQFPGLLKNEIEKGLPGSGVQWEMASSDRMVRNFPRTAGPDAAVAAVLILLYPYKGSVHTVFMQRHNYPGVHGGQISFPGGKKEQEDRDIIHTALRETEEETGADSSKIIVIGTLTPLFIPVSNIVVTPVVGWINDRPGFNHQAEEVVFLFDAELRRFLDKSIIKIKPFEIRGELINVRYFDYDGHVIWGATAMMLNELLTIIRSGNML
jgi:8-oxo-dGTP pyrophosphatase MutT (NUDIX family)